MIPKHLSSKVAATWVPIEDVVEFQEGPGVRKYQYRDAGVKLLNGSNINDNILNLSNTERYISDEEAYGKYRHFLVDEGDLLIASSGIAVDKFHTKIAYALEEHLPLCMNTSTIRFKTKDGSKLNLDYFRRFLSTNLFKKQLGRLITGSAQLNFGPSHLKQMYVPLPTLKEQKRIAAILDKADAIRRKRQQAIDLTDKFLRSVFLELFGDPVKNPKGWDKLPIEELSERVTKGSSPKWQGFEYQNEGVRFVTSENVLWGKLDNRKKYISEDFHKKLIRSSLKENDLLINLVGASVGRACLVPLGGAPANINQAVAVTTLRNHKIIPEFLLAQVLTASMQRELLGNVVDAARANISLTNIRELSVIVPPVESQENFMKIVDKVTVINGKHQLSSESLLFESLTKSAFRGDLTKQTEAA